MGSGYISVCDSDVNPSLGAHSIELGERLPVSLGTLTIVGSVGGGAADGYILCTRRGTKP